MDRVTDLNQGRSKPSLLRGPKTCSGAFALVREGRFVPIWKRSLLPYAGHRGQPMSVASYGLIAHPEAFKGSG